MRAIIQNRKIRQSICKYLPKAVGCQLVPTHAPTSRPRPKATGRVQLLLAGTMQKRGGCADSADTGNQEARLVRVTVDAAGVGKQMAQRDLVAARKIRDVLRQRIAHAKFSIFMPRCRRSDSSPLADRVGSEGKLGRGSSIKARAEIKVTAGFMVNSGFFPVARMDSNAHGLAQRSAH
jgi:hypothetical protein